MYLGDTWVVGFPFADTQKGVQLNFFDCAALPHYLGVIRYFAFGAVDPCCEYGATSVELIDCNFDDNYMPPGKKLVMNANDTCRCDQPLAVRVGTWGLVKALYR